MSEEDAAREGSYPFTTITPNVGRGSIALPDPSPLLGLSQDQVQPAYGFAPGLDIIKLQQAGFSSIGPLQQLVKDCGWQQQPLAAGADAGVGGDGVLWRRVPVVVKDVAGLVPGGPFFPSSSLSVVGMLVISKQGQESGAAVCMSCSPLQHCAPISCRSTLH